MAAAVWTACTKLLLEEKSWAPERAVFAPGFCCLWAFLKGGSEKAAGSGWFFMVIFVVEVWWEYGFWMVLFRSWEFSSPGKFFCGKRSRMLESAS